MSGPTMIARRQALIGGAALSLLPDLLFPGALHAALPVPPSGKLGFDILRKGSKLGSHVLTFTPQGDKLTVAIEVSLIYKLLGMTLYHYSHHCTESWDGGQVVALDSRTDDNGTPHHMSARRTAAGLEVSGSDAPKYIAPANAMPATHWNQRELDGPWINTQDGKLAHPHVTPAGTEAIPAVGGKMIEARRYNLSGDVQMAIWYDRLGWAGLGFDRGGAPIRYERRG